MVRGCDVSRIGYVGVVNRGQRDIDNNLTIREALKKELHFFKNHAVYKTCLQRYGGGCS
jgi:dynamin 1-like protein